jgi:hypothetical protein
VYSKGNAAQLPVRREWGKVLILTGRTGGVFCGRC